MTSTVFRANQDCRALGSTVQIVALKAQVEDPAPMAFYVFVIKPFDKTGKPSSSCVIFRRDEI